VVIEVPLQQSRDTGGYWSLRFLIFPTGRSNEYHLMSRLLTIWSSRKAAMEWYNLCRILKPCHCQQTCVARQDNTNKGEVSSCNQPCQWASRSWTALKTDEVSHGVTGDAAEMHLPLGKTNSPAQSIATKHSARNYPTWWLKLLRYILYRCRSPCISGLYL
jgi:hypothetical protein